MPDSNTFQEEVLVLRENVGRAKLYPDIENNIQKNLIDSNVRITQNVDTIYINMPISVEDFNLDLFLKGKEYNLQPPTANYDFRILFLKDYEVQLSYDNKFKLVIAHIDKVSSTNTYSLICKVIRNQETPDVLTLENKLNKYLYYLYSYENQNTFF